MENIKETLSDGSKNGVLIVSDQILQFRAQGNFKMAILAERVMLNHKSFSFNKNHFLFKAFDRKLSQLVEAGLAKRFIDEFENDYKMEREPDVEPEVLSFEHLSVGFQIWLLFLLVSFLCFCLELLRSFCLKKITSIAARYIVGIAVQVYLDELSHH